MAYKYKLKTVGGEASKFSDFIERNGLSILVTERERHLRERLQLPTYFADIELTGARDGSCMLTSLSGNGRTPEGAIDDLAEQCRGRLLIYRPAGGEHRREIQCPNEWLPE